MITTVVWSSLNEIYLYSKVLKNKIVRFLYESRHWQLEIDVLMATIKSIAKL